MENIFEIEINVRRPGAPPFPIDLILALQAIFTRLASFNALTKSGSIQDVSISCSCLSVTMLQYSLHNRHLPYICIIVSLSGWRWRNFIYLVFYSLKN
jgi:hypothetical protein